MNNNKYFNYITTANSHKPIKVFSLINKSRLLTNLKEKNIITFAAWYVHNLKFLYIQYDLPTLGIISDNQSE